MQLQQPLRVAVIGGSGIIGKRHCDHVVKNYPTTQLVAIVDPSESAVEVARRHSVPLYTNIDDLLCSTDRPDAAIVCTPNHTHVPLCVELAQGGIKNILCEKPISTSIETARSLVQLPSLRLLIGHHRRFNPYVLAAKDILSSGLLGPITAVSGLWTTLKPSAYFSRPHDWRASQSRGGGVVLINFIHEIDLLHHLFGPVARVHAEKTTSRRRRRAPEQGDAAEEGAALTLRFRSGVVGSFVLSDHVASPHSFEQGTGENPMLPRSGRDCYRILGTRGTLSFPDMTLSTYEGEASWEKEMVSRKVMVKDRQVAPFDTQLKHFAAVCRGEAEPSCSGEDGLRALMVCEAIRKAIDNEQGGGTVNIDDM